MFELLEVNPTEPGKIEFLDPTLFNNTADQRLNDAMRAAEAHRRVRNNLQQKLKPGISLFEIIDFVETSTRTMLRGEKNNGIGFPCGVSLNNCAAHFSLNPGNKDIILKETDLLKIDFGTHSNGRIMDSAFTVCFDPKYEQLLRATKAATECGLKVIGVDMQVCEIGREINEVFKSFEIELDGRLVPIKPVSNLHGHSIEQFKIHGGLSIPQINNGDHSRIKEGFCAIETFATTGAGYVNEKGECSHFMLNTEQNNNSRIYNAKNEMVLEVIKREFATLPFSPRHAEFYVDGSLTSIKLLSLRHFIDPYPPLYDVEKSMVAQFEHTIYITENGKTVLTRGSDY
ncbi:methionyl aminopeptidase [Pancytospora epiphaga]|nr:methionyl aminopeptidase [Pancytospora epiphaga]